MSEAPALDIDTATAIVEGLKSKETFDARSAINGTTYATDTVKVYLNAALAHQMNLAADDLIKVRHRIENLTASDSGIVGSPEKDEAEAEAEALEAKIAELGEQVRSSALTFHVRGLAPAQYRLIYKKWRKAIKPPVRKNYAPDEAGEEEYELEVFERNIERNAKIHQDQVASATVKVVSAAGDEDTAVWKQEDVEKLYEALLDVEWDKLKGTVENLTFAHTIFQSTIEQDADFLAKH